MGHISAFMALASQSDGPTYTKAVKLLSMKYTIAEAALVWDSWAPFMVIPEGHHLAGGIAGDFVVSSLCKPSNTQRLAKEAAKGLVDNLLGFVTIQTLLDHTISEDLEEEEEGNQTT